MTLMPQAVPLHKLLMNPFPTPKVYTVNIRKPKGAVGIRCRSDKKRGSTFISEILSGPLDGTELREGQILLAVNGVSITDAVEATEQIKRVTEGNALTLVACDEVKAPFCKMIAAPRWMHNPGLNFSSIREDCLVQVSRIFASGPFANTSLKRGDLILTVNGVSVSKLYQADHALRIHRNESMTFLYVIDIDSLRKSVLTYMFEIFPDVTLRQRVEPGGKANKVILEYNRYNFYVEGECKAIVEYNTETQLLQDPERYMHLRAVVAEAAEFVDTEGQSAELCFMGRYQSHVNPFLVKFNRVMENQLRLIEEAVCCEAWKQQPIFTYYEPTLNLQPPILVHAFPLAEAQRLSQTSSSSSVEV